MNIGPEARYSGRPVTFREVSTMPHVVYGDSTDETLYGDTVHGAGGNDDIKGDGDGQK